MEDVVLVAAGLIAIYSFAGGLVSAVVTDFLQGLLIIALSFLLLPLAYSRFGGLHVLRDHIGADMFSLVAPQEVTLFYVCMVVINALVGVPVQPHAMAIGGAGRNELDARVGLTYGNFLKRFCTIGWALAGLYAVAMYPGLEHRELAFGVLARNLLPTGLVGLMLAATLAAMMSTCDSLSVAGAGLATQNIYRKIARADRSDRHFLFVGRLAGLFVIGGGVLFALVFPSVVSMLEYFWKITAFLGIAFWGGLLWPRANRTGAWASALVSASVSFLLEWHGGYGLATQIAIYLPAGVLALVLGSLLGPSEPAKKIADFYSTLTTPVGEETRLRASGVDIVFSGFARRPTQPGGLILADVPLKRPITWRNHKVDLLGFAIAWGVVALLQLLVYMIALVGRSG